MAVKLSPMFNEQQMDANGVPLSGGKLYTYAAGSSTPQTSYTDNTGTVPQSNPIILNSRGEVSNPIWLTAGLNYKFALYDALNNLIRTVDNVSGVNDSSVALSEWVDSGVTPTYVNATQFTVPGDQTSAFQVGRRVKCTVTAGTVYGSITVSAYTALTTVTVVLDSGALDSGLSAVQLGLVTVNSTSSPQAGIVHNATSKATPVDADEIPLVDSAASNVLKKLTWTNLKAALSAYFASTNPPPVRQTVISGPVDANGLAAFGGSTGSTTVTASGTLIATAAAGGNSNYTGSIVNPSWTGLSTNGTMYLYLDITSAGVVSTGSTTLAPVYQWGGTYSTTSGQNTYNIQEATMKVGNGASATQVYRVFVGEVTVAGGVTTAIVWYQLNGMYDSGFTATLPSGSVSKNHNIGLYPSYGAFQIECTTAENGYSIGDRLIITPSGVETGAQPVPMLGATRLSIFTVASLTSNWACKNKSTGVNTSLTNANWKYKFVANRGW